MPHKQRGVYEHPKGSGHYWIHYYDAEGQRHRESIGRYDLACDTYYERKRAIREGRFRPPERATGLTFKALLDMAFAERRHHLSYRTYEGNVWTAGRLLKEFGTMPAARITAERIAEYLGALRDSGVKGPSANQYHSLLSAVFSWGVLHKKLERNPCRDVKPFRDSDKRVRFLDSGEEDAIRAAIRAAYPDGEAEFDLALHTGARRNELFRLQWDNVDLERGILTIHGKAHANSEETRIRHVPINSAAAEALSELHARSRGSAFVFPRSLVPRPADEASREKKRDRRQWFEECVEAAGVVNFHYHDLRHTFASRLRMAGVELADIMELLGHTTLQMVMRYAHLAPGHQKANVELLVPAKAGRRRGPRILQQTIAKAVASVAERGGAWRSEPRTAIKTAISGKQPSRKAALDGAQIADKAKVG